MSTNIKHRHHALALYLDRGAHSLPARLIYSPHRPRHYPRNSDYVSSNIRKWSQMFNKIIYYQKHKRPKHNSKIQIIHILPEQHFCRYIVKIKLFHFDVDDYFIYIICQHMIKRLKFLAMATRGETRQ